MEEKNVPYIVYEGTMARFERTIKRLTVIIIVSLLLLFVTNALWIYEWTMYDYSEVTVDSNDGGNANFLQAGSNGEITNAESGGQEKN